MSEPILIRSTNRTWDLTLAILAGIGLFIYALVGMNNANKGVAIALEVLGVCGIIVCVLILRQRIASRRWITVAADHFTLIDRLNEVTHQDQDVCSISIQTKRNFSNGEFISCTQKILLWITDPRDRTVSETRLTHTVKVGQTDPLADFTNRLVQRVRDQALQLINSNRNFVGDGWELEKDKLVILTKREPLHCHLNDISLIRVVDEKLCIWQKGSAEPWKKLDIDSLNAWILLDLLDEQLKSRQEDEASQGEDELGEVIFERTTRTFLKFIMVLGAFTLFLLAVALSFAAFQVKAEERITVIIVSVIAIAGFFGVSTAFLNSLYFRFRCHRLGLLKINLFGTRQLRYAQVENFKFHATRQFYNGAYTGTSLVMEFVPFVDSGLKSIRFGATLMNLDTELDNLREFVSAVVGSRMYDDVAAGKTVRWTPDLAFHGDSLHHTTRKIFSRGEVKSYPIRDLTKFRFNVGQLELFDNQGPKPIIRASTQEMNFFPGFHCWLKLVNAPIQGKETEK